MKKSNFFVEVVTALLLLLVLECANNDWVVVLLVTLQVRVFLAYIKNIHITTGYLYAQLILVLFIIVSMAIATVVPVWALVIDKVCPIVLTYLNMNVMTEDEYQKWLSFVKRVIMMGNDLIVYVEKED